MLNTENFKSLYVLILLLFAKKLANGFPTLRFAFALEMQCKKHDKSIKIAPHVLTLM